MAVSIYSSRVSRKITGVQLFTLCFLTIFVIALQPNILLGTAAFKTARITATKTSGKGNNIRDANLSLYLRKTTLLGRQAAEFSADKSLSRIYSKNRNENDDRNNDNKKKSIETTNNSKNTSNNNSKSKAKTITTTKQEKIKYYDPGAQFDMQEMKMQCDAMKNAKISSARLTDEKRNEIERYVRNIVKKWDSPIPLSSLGLECKTDLIGTWRLGFSTENVQLTALPKEARIYVNVLDEYELEYTLKFTKKVWGLGKLTASSFWRVDSKNPGLVVFTYQAVSMVVFGLTLPIGFFGLLNGQENYIQTAYFDGTCWIERGLSPEGFEFFNVYFREE